MELYESTTSPNSRRVRIFLAEKEITVPFVPVNLGAKEQFSEPYRAVNPRSVVPTLVLNDGTVIGEVLAIWRYFEEIHPEPALMGSTPTEKAMVTMWERRVELEGFAAVMEVVRNSVPSLKGRALTGPRSYEQIPALAERSKLRARHFYDDLYERLKSVPFGAGDRFSVADITAVVTIDFATRAIGLPIPEEHVALKAWYERVSARPSITA